MLSDKNCEKKLGQFVSVKLLPNEVSNGIGKLKSALEEVADDDVLSVEFDGSSLLSNTCVCSSSTTRIFRLVNSL